MQHTIKKVIDAEFAANSMEVTCKVEPYIWQHNIPTDYRTKLLFRGGQIFMEIICKAQRPFVPKMKPNAPIEPHKLIKLCEIVQEAFKELERKSEEGEGQFR
ncbi:hypothetical protein KDU71_07605 [Carboxylicivirga sediminis]|uniref:Uncharacterized protein n=1 Tax=Carboxylicivirga sediminis TaxID=2006564 RepID=A0A941IY43_9BACT|nr:hypothetical protein [Carboxylicivirga sediminis]MBR8535422.1 hypothetical protein [Carboxylicivirga sediminis]